MIHLTLPIAHDQHDALLNHVEFNNRESLNMRGLSQHMFNTQHKLTDLAFRLRADSEPDQYDKPNTIVDYKYLCKLDVDYYDVESGYDAATGDVGTVYVYMIQANYADPQDEMLVRLEHGVST